MLVREVVITIRLDHALRELLERYLALDEDRQAAKKLTADVHAKTEALNTALHGAQTPPTP